MPPLRPAKAPRPRSLVRTAPSPRLRKRTNYPRPDGSGKKAAKAKAARRGAEADRPHTDAEATAAETDIAAEALTAAAVSDLNQLNFLLILLELVCPFQQLT